MFTLGGWWLDRQFESLSPLFTVVGALLGFAGATVSLVYQVLGSTKRK